MGIIKRKLVFLAFGNLTKSLKCLLATLRKPRPYVKYCRLRCVHIGFVASTQALCKLLQALLRPHRLKYTRCRLCYVHLGLCKLPQAPSRPLRLHANYCRLRCVHIGFVASTQALCKLPQALLRPHRLKYTRCRLCYVHLGLCKLPQARHVHLGFM